MAGVKGIEVELSAVITEYTAEVEEKTFQAVRKAALKCKRDIKAASPVRSGDYKKGWTVRNERSRGLITSTVYNKDEPGLTHLLEKSHVIRNQFGSYGRSTPKEHIGPAAEEATKYLEELIQQELG